MSHANTFRVTTSRSDGLHTMSLAGELDMAAVLDFEPVVLQLLADAAPSVLVLDLGGLTFIDSSGIRSMLLVKEQCEARGCSFSVVRPSDAVFRFFELSGLGDSLPWMSVPEAEDPRAGAD